jgi:hypothetical protein
MNGPKAATNPNALTTEQIDTVYPGSRAALAGGATVPAKPNATVMAGRSDRFFQKPDGTPSEKP